MTSESKAINSIFLKKLPSLDPALSELRSLGQVSAQLLNDDWRIRNTVEWDLWLLYEDEIAQLICDLKNQPSGGPL